MTLIQLKYALSFLSLQAAGRRRTLAPECTRFTGPSRDVLVLFASTGGLLPFYEPPAPI